MQSGPKLGPKPNSLALWTLYWEQCICIQMLASLRVCRLQYEIHAEKVVVTYAAADIT